MKILYVGSGQSAAKIRNLDITGWLTCAANNAWRLFDDMQPCDYWIHSGDFPAENSAPSGHFKHEVSYPEYAPAAEAVCEELACETRFPQHHLGYTIFFQGLYWIMWTLRPKEIYLLGFDHDYDPGKVKKWEDGGCPGPQNQFFKPVTQSITEWSCNYFEGYRQDAFYGHGTPDPMRLGQGELRELFERGLDYSARLGVRVFNASEAPPVVNLFPFQPLLPTI